jgi:hypothetical protein
MDLTSRQRQLVFALTVIALAGLGFFLLRSGIPGHHSPKPSQPPPAAASSPAVPRSPAVPSSPATPAATPTQTGRSSTTSSQVNIYRWLPFTEPQLARAASVVTEFSADYGTFSYHETPAAYTARMQGLITSQLAQVIGRAYATPGVAKIRTQQKQVSAGSAVIGSLRAFGSSSLTFVVTIHQKITGTSPSQQSTQYAVTVSDSNGGWQVTDIELASSGNQ